MSNNYPRLTITYAFETEQEMAEFVASKVGTAAKVAESKPAAAAETKPAATAKAEPAQKAAKPAATKAEPKASRNEMNAALNEVKEAKGAPVAKGIIADVGGSSMMKDIPEDKIEAVYAAAKAALVEAVVESDDDM